MAWGRKKRAEKKPEKKSPVAKEPTAPAPKKTPIRSEMGADLRAVVRKDEEARRVAKKETRVSLPPKPTPALKVPVLDRAVVAPKPVAAPKPVPPPPPKADRYASDSLKDMPKTLALDTLAQVKHAWGALNMDTSSMVQGLALGQINAMKTAVKKRAKELKLKLDGAHGG